MREPRLPYRPIKVIPWWTNGVMADQRKALSDTTELTETVYFVHPTGIYLILAHAIGCQVHEIQIYLILKLN